MTPAIRVVVVDDHALFRNGLVLLLGLDTRVAVVGEGSNGGEAVQLAKDLMPDVMLLDVEMLDGTNVDSVIRRIRRLVPSVLVIVLTMHRDTVLKRQLLRAGAVEYVTKNVSGPDLVEIIARVRRQARTDSLIVDLEHEPRGLLSDRELQVLRMISQAQSNRDIGASLSIAEGTVKRHTNNIYTKLGATSRIDAVRKAIRLGIF